MNKKAGLPDLIFIVIAFFALAVIFLLSYTIFSKVNDELQASEQISGQGKDMANDIMTRFPTLFDRIFLFIVIGLGIGIVAGAWFIPSHPALFWISVPVLAFIIWLGGLYANIFAEISDNAEISGYAASFPIMTFIFDHYIILIMVYSIVVSIALYAKAKVE